MTITTNKREQREEAIFTTNHILVKDNNGVNFSIREFENNDHNKKLHRVGQFEMFDFNNRRVTGIYATVSKAIEAIEAMEVK